MQPATGEEDVGTPAPTRAERPRGDRGATATFAAVEVVALGLWLYLGRFQWFFRDEWEFIAGRTTTDLDTFFRPHNEHWTTAPIVAYRLLYWLFGMRSYLPYRLLVLAVYLTTAALLLLIMRRAGVHPWIATAAASLFAFFGAGWQNIIQPFQVCFTGALMFGLLQLLLADHDGPFDRRDWLGIGAGLVGLMCSGVGVAMIVIVGISVCLRRGWRLAMLHVVPAATCYVVWLTTIGRRRYGSHHATAENVFRFVASGLRGSYRALGQIPALGIVLAAVLIVGLALAIAETRRARNAYELAAPIALLAGSVIVLAITALGRVEFGPDFARESRYLSLVAAMTIPALAVAADALVRRWRRLMPLAIAIFLVGIPGNISALADDQRQLKPAYKATRQTMLSLARVPRARVTPRSLHPDSVGAESVTIGWLLDGVADHKIPAPGAIPRSLRMSDDYRLSFYQHRGHVPTTSCTTLRVGRKIALEAGDVVGVFENAIAIGPANGRRLVGPTLQFTPSNRMPVTVVADPDGPSFVRSAHPFFPARICVDRSRPTL
jgi:hypothetical protein